MNTGVCGVTSEPSQSSNKNISSFKDLLTLLNIKSKVLLIASTMLISIYLSIYLPIDRSIDLSIYIYISIYNIYIDIYYI